MLFNLFKVLISCFLLINLSMGQISNSDSDATNYQGSNGAEPRTNGQVVPLPYQQPYIIYYQALPQQQLLYGSPYPYYPLPSGSVQGYNPVLYSNNNNNIRKRDDHTDRRRHENGPREFYPGAGYQGYPEGGNNKGGFHGGINNFVGAGNDPYPHIKADIIDVDPAYQRQLLGPIIDEVGGHSRQHYTESGPDHHFRHHHHRKPHYIVKTSSSSSNYTSAPEDYSKPLITQNSYSTTIRRTFVNEPNQPQKPINLHFVNGVQVNTEAPSGDETPAPEITTTLAAETTTENENPQETTVKPSLQGRRFIDVPKTCPSGTKIAHNGQCLETFKLAIPSFGSQSKSVDNEATTTFATTTTVEESE